MIAAQWRPGDDQEAIYLGLTVDDVERLRAGQPLLVTAKHLEGLRLSTVLSIVIDVNESPDIPTLQGRLELARAAT